MRKTFTTLAALAALGIAAPALAETPAKTPAPQTAMAKPEAKTETSTQARKKHKKVAHTRIETKAEGTTAK